MAMFDQSQNLKTRVDLNDYDYKREIASRVLLGSLNSDEAAILEEITYSPTSFSINMLATNTGFSADTVLKTLEKIQSSGLFTINGSDVTIDKDTRKYFELHIEKFDDDFCPDLNFLKSLIKRVPLDVLPLWYPIPRSSDNIFDSLLERFLHTPSLFDRYKSEIALSNENLKNVIDALESSENGFVSFKTLEKRYGLSKQEFYHFSLELEFLLIAAHTFERVDEELIEGVTFFKEWKKYLQLKKRKVPVAIDDSEQANVHVLHNDTFFFTKLVTRFLALLEKESISLTLNSSESWTVAPDSLILVRKVFHDLPSDTEEQMHYFEKTLEQVIRCACVLKLMKIKGSCAHLDHEKYQQWSELSVEKQALYLYRTLIANYPFHEITESGCKERKVHEIEKSLLQILDQKWVKLSHFLKNLTVHLSQDSACQLTRLGKKWRYSEPSYSKLELELIETVIYEWLFQAGAIYRGVFEGEPCIRLTDFGKKVFGSP